MFTDSVACPRDPFSPYLLALLAVPCCRMPFLLTGRALVNPQSVNALPSSPPTTTATQCRLAVLTVRSEDVAPPPAPAPAHGTWVVAHARGYSCQATGHLR